MTIKRNDVRVGDQIRVANSAPMFLRGREGEIVALNASDSVLVVFDRDVHLVFVNEIAQIIK